MATDIVDNFWNVVPLSGSTLTNVFPVFSAPEFSQLSVGSRMESEVVDIAPGYSRGYGQDEEEEEEDFDQDEIDLSRMIDFQFGQNGVEDIDSEDSYDQESLDEDEDGYEEDFIDDSELAQARARGKGRKGKKGARRPKKSLRQMFSEVATPDVQRRYPDYSQSAVELAVDKLFDHWQAKRAASGL